MVDDEVARRETRVELLRRHAFSVARRFLRQTADAEDVVQEALLRLLKARSNGAAISDERAFMTTVAVRLAIDRLRTARVRRRPLQRESTVRSSDAETSSTPAEIQRLYEAIAALPPKQSAVITLRKVMELEYDDIAAILGVSLESCRSHCRLGLKRLREKLCE